MPIDIHCQHCQGKFRVADKFAGKRVKCPSCKETIAVPGAAGAEAPAASAAASAEALAAKPAGPTPAAASAEKKPVARAASKAPVTKEKPAAGAAATAPAEAKKPAAPGKPAAKSPPVAKKPAAKDEWYVQTAENEQYGPVTKKDLDDWVGEGRVDGSCQLLQDGWEQWKWAEEVYPQLAESPAAPPAAIDLSAAPLAVPAPETAPLVQVNPYAAPQASPIGILTEQAASGGVNKVVLRAMQQTHPWVLFLSILGFISNGLATLGVLVLTVLAAVASPLAALMGLMMLVGPVLGLASSSLLFAYASRIGVLLRRDGPRELEHALLAQKAFWKFSGILALVMIVLSIAMAVLVFAIGGLAALSALSAAHSMGR